MISITDAIKKLEVIFDKANEKFYDNKLIRPIITIQTGKRSVLGWCSVGKRWVDSDNSYYEINIVAENLARSLDDIVETMLHEMVHLYNSQHGVSDCTRTQYHNKKFKEVAEAHGLIAEKAGYRGYTLTKLNDDGVKFVNELTANGIGDFELNRGVPSESEPKIGIGKTPIKMYTYECECGIKIRNKSGLLNIVCGDCGCKFELQEGKKNQN